jgi:tetratricopeptide (TPR) repeat protein
MAPPANEKDFRFVLYNLGGSIFNILSVIPFIILYIALPHSVLLNSIILAGVLMNALLAVLNLIPIMLNDGRNVVTALKSKDAKRGFYLIFLADSKTMNGKRYSEMDGELLNVSDTADFNNRFVSYIVILESAYLYDLGEYDKSIECYDKLKNAKLPAYYSNMIKIDYIYYYTVHKPDFEKARELFADKKLKKFLKMQVPSVTRVLAAYEYIVNGDKDKGRKLLQRAKNEIKNFPNSGVKLMETDYCAKLEEIIIKD